MTHRLVPALLLTATLYALGAGIASLPLPPPAAASSAGNALAQAIPTLPTVVVRPDIEPTLLPTVTVRPGPAEIAAAKALDSGALRAGSVVVAMHTLGGGLLPRSTLDMPYYSFGKSAYRVSKE
jgi:hypothetical protein